MNVRAIAAIPVYGLGYVVLTICGLVAVAGGALLALAEHIRFYERPPVRVPAWRE